MSTDSLKMVMEAEILQGVRNSSQAELIGPENGRSLNVPYSLL